MKQDIKEVYCKALRDNKHRQCRHSLKIRELRCAIGILYEEYCKIHDMDWYYFITQGYIPEADTEFGLTNTEKYKIINMNDGREKSFDEIADEVETWS